MSAGSTERVIQRLAEDLAPVRPVPRLRVALATVLAAWAAVLAFVLLRDGARAELWGSLFSNAAFGGVFVGLALAAIGGAAAGLASGVPGREAVVRTGSAAALAGLAAAAGLCLVFLAAFGASDGSPFSTDGICFRRSAVFAVLPAAGLVAFSVRGWVQRPLRAGAIALLGAVALGSLVAHVSCPFFGARHLLLGHVGAPVALALLGALPLGLTLRRFAR